MRSSFRAELRTPVILVTGFLGCGKTTLVNRLLQTPAFSRAAVVVNEFGEISVDHVLINAPRDRMRVIDSGCICGHVHEEVASSLLDLDSSRKTSAGAQFDAVLIETSGLADPVPIIHILVADPEITASFELQCVITVADGVQGCEQLDLNQESVKQAAVADTLLISKTDVACEDSVSRLASRLRDVNPGAPQIRIAHGDLDPSLIGTNAFRVGSRFGARAWLKDSAYARGSHAGVDSSINTFTVEYAAPITVPGLVLWLHLLAGFRGAGLLRVKGIVNVEGRPFAIQAVQRVISEPEPLDCWPEGSDRRSRLVFITRGMDARDIRRTFDTFSIDFGRQSRNMVINPQRYSAFRDAMQTFRSPGQWSDQSDPRHPRQ